VRKIRAQWKLRKHDPDRFFVWELYRAAWRGQIDCCRQSRRSARRLGSPHTPSRDRSPHSHRKGAQRHARSQLHFPGRAKLRAALSPIEEGSRGAAILPRGSAGSEQMDQFLSHCRRDTIRSRLPSRRAPAGHDVVTRCLDALIVVAEWAAAVRPFRDERVDLGGGSSKAVYVIPSHIDPLLSTTPGFDDPPPRLDTLIAKSRTAAAPIATTISASNNDVTTIVSGRSSRRQSRQSPELDNPSQ